MLTGWSLFVNQQTVFLFNLANLRCVNKFMDVHQKAGVGPCTRHFEVKSLVTAVISCKPLGQELQTQVGNESASCVLFFVGYMF